MEELIKVLEKTVSNIQSDQNEAIRYIEGYIARDIPGFLKALSEVLFNQQNPPIVRTAAGLQLKNQLTSRDETVRIRQQERWRSLPEETRHHIKERVFRTLGTELFRPSSAPQCVAYIAIIELPDHQWPELIQSLTNNITDLNNTIPLRLASLEAIGHIFRNLDKPCPDVTDSKMILDAIVTGGMGDNESDEIKSAATSALMNFSETKILAISRLQQIISFADLGEYLNIEPQYAERIMAQMIREDRLKGHLDQIERSVYFESKDVLQLFDEEILKLCSEVNDVIEKIRQVVPEDWWAANAGQSDHASASKNLYVGFS